MTKAERIDPMTALDKVYQIIRDEASSNPTFGSRLLEAVGYTVIFRGDEAIEALDPMLVGMNGREAFFKTFLSFTEKEIEKIGVANSLLLKGAAGKGKAKLTKQQLVQLFWESTEEKIEDLFPRSRHAAE